LPDVCGCVKLIVTALFFVICTYPAGAQKSDPTQLLFQAVEVNDIGAVKKALATGADLNAHDANGMTPADLAVDKGHFIIAHFLLSERSASKTAKRKAAPLTATDLTKRPRPKTPQTDSTSAAAVAPANNKRITQLMPPQRIQKPRPKRKRVAKRDRFEIPPHKPHPPIVGEVAIGPGPGVEQPDGSAPPESTRTEMPRVADKIDRKDRVARGEKPTASSDKPGPVESFFQSLVNLVTPDDPPVSSRKQTAERIADSTGKENPDKHLAPRAEIGPKSPAEGTTVDRTPETVEITDDLPVSESAGPERNGGPLSMEELVNDSPPERTDPGDESSAARTFDRIKSLLSADAPKEDEFGLPIIDTPATGQSGAVDSVLNQLSNEPNLDDQPGPETGPPPDPITAEDQGLSRARVSDALRNRLKRLGDAVSRDVTVDTNAILDAGRKRFAHMVPRDPQQTPTARSDVAAEKMMVEGKKLKPRKTSAGRFNERIEKIRRTENAREDAYGLPDKKAGDAKSDTTASLEADQGGSTVDRMIEFFTGKDRTPIVSRENKTPFKEVPDYMKAPDSGDGVPVDMDQSDIANLDSFDKTDETKPVNPPAPAQVRGNIPPQFLERLSVLFNEEGQALEQGWKAKANVGEGAPGELEESTPQEQTPWTTTSKLSIGVGRPMAVIKVSKTEIPTGEAEVAKTADVASDKHRMMAGAPYSDPLKSPPSKKEARKKAFFSRLTQLFQPKDHDSLPRESLLLEQDEKLSTTHDALKSDVKVASRNLDEARTYWPITELSKAEPSPVPERRPNALTRTSLSGVVLTLGESVNLDNTFPPGNEGTDSRNQCVRKNRGTTQFCIEPVDWPDELTSTFQVTTILYTGPMAITRFDQGAATRLHSLFNSEDFEKITAYYRKRFGEPTEIWKRSIAPLAQPRQDNPTVSWRDRDPETNAISILEIRKFDDTRGGFPDTKRGAVMLYFVNSPPIFPQVSAHELMQLKRVAKKTETEAELTPKPNIDDAPAGSEVAPDELFGAPAKPAASDAIPADPILDSMTNDTQTPALDELLKDSEQPASDNILDQLTTEDPNDLLKNLPNEQPVTN